MKQPRVDDLDQEVVVSVIIPTTCEASRSELLMRAIESITSQELEKGRIEILLVCNGGRQDAGLLEKLESLPCLRIFKLPEGNVSKARYFGVSNIKGDFFCFLDDDDELLADSVKNRLKILKADPACDVVVPNGFIHIQGKDEPMATSCFASIINSNLCRSFLKQNWFASPAPLFRARTIQPSIFDFSFRYFEWTYLFFLLVSLQKNIKFDGEFLYRKYEDNPLSASKTMDYSFAYPDFLKKLKELDLPLDIKSAIHDKYLAALNTQSNIYLQRREFGKAWSSHLACLVKGGWRYLPYTRFLIFSRFR